MCYVYIIESIASGKRYIGSSNNVEQRVEEHNLGKTRSTKPFAPYKVIYTEKFETKTEALKRERQIKRSGSLRKQLRDYLTNKAPSSNG